MISCRQKSERQTRVINWKDLLSMKEQQLTVENKGHNLHNTQVFSPDDRWIVYDTRNDETRIDQNCCIQMVNINTREIRLLYTTAHQSVYGPGVGAATFNPIEQKVLFIHGLLNCDSSRPYGIDRRTGVAIETAQPGLPVFMDARDVVPPFTPGALRGGTHAHTWSADGKWVSFTYNDAVMAELGKKDKKVKDLRMVGVMAPYGPLEVKKAPDGENNDGKMFTVVVTRITENPAPGSDEIEKAYEDGWIGTNGYVRLDGTRQKRAIAFLGDTRDSANNLLTEVFITDVPDDITKAVPDNPVEGTEKSRPMPPAGTKQRRLTFTADRQYPGVQGPRHWMRSKPDGSLIFFMMMDAGITHHFSGYPHADAMQKALDVEAKVGIKVNVSCPELKSDPEKTVRCFMNHPAVAGYHLMDEPGMPLFKELGDWARRIQTIDSKHFCYVNLFPNIRDEDSARLGTNNFRDYVSECAKQIPLQFLSFDFYPVLKDGLSKRWYENLEQFSDEAKKKQVNLFGHLHSQLTMMMGTLLHKHLLR